MMEVREEEHVLNKLEFSKETGTYTKPGIWKAWRQWGVFWELEEHSQNPFQEQAQNGRRHVGSHMQRSKDSGYGGLAHCVPVAIPKEASHARQGRALPWISWIVSSDRSLWLLARGTSWWKTSLKHVELFVSINNVTFFHMHILEPGNKSPKKKWNYFLSIQEWKSFSFFLTSLRHWAPKLDLTRWWQLYTHRFFSHCLTLAIQKGVSLQSTMQVLRW